jgi:phosphatidylglycerophosphate synthase
MLLYQEVRQILVITREGLGEEVKDHLHAHPWDLEIDFLELDAETLSFDFDALRKAKEVLWETLLVARADYVYDARALTRMVSSRASTLLVGSRPVLPRAQLETTPQDATYYYGLSLLNRVTLGNEEVSWPSSDGASPSDSLEQMERDGLVELLRLDALPTYMVNLRRSLPIACFALQSDEDVRVGEHILIDATQKGTLDFPAQYLHPAPENWITRRLLNTSVTPNLVTLVSNLVAFVGLWFFWEGRMAEGVASALAVGILDGVDGKLARLKLQYSRFGDKLDHVLDLIYEPLWYLAIGGFLSRQTDYSDLTFVRVSIAIVALYFLDRIATGAFKLIRKIELFDYSGIDRLVRKLGARRNTNVLLLLVGVILGGMDQALWAILLLTVITTLFHCVRAIQLSLCSKDNH